ILFTGGGTAGHVIVNLALIPEFKEKGWQVDYIGSYDGIENDLIQLLPGVSYHAISTGKLRRYMSIENFKDPFKVLKGIFQAWRIIGKKKPQVIFSKGGFVSVPVIIAAKLRGVPTVIHESDYTPGLANKLAIPFAKNVLTTFKETAEQLNKQKVNYVGAVVRDELFTGDVTEGLSLTQLTNEKPIILIIGGSSGSQRLNQIVRDNLDELLKDYQIIHICGENNIDQSMNKTGYAQFGYVNDELKHLFKVADFVISRAGSNAIFEFLSLKIPMLLIPLPLSASRGDQIVNAKSFKKNGYAHVLRDEEMTVDSFLEAVNALVTEKDELLEAMSHYQSSRSKENVIQTIIDVSK